MIDHTSCEGMPVGGGMKEFPTITCSHCQQVLIINPDRTRERGYCPKCDHYVCDRCEVIRLNQGCKTYKQIMDEYEESVINQI